MEQAVEVNEADFQAKSCISQQVDIMLGLRRMRHVMAMAAQSGLRKYKDPLPMDSNSLISIDQPSLKQL
jgi:hypothetical protein